MSFYKWSSKIHLHYYYSYILFKRCIFYFFQIFYIRFQMYVQHVIYNLNFVNSILYVKRWFLSLFWFWKSININILYVIEVLIVCALKNVTLRIFVYRYLRNVFYEFRRFGMSQNKLIQWWRMQNQNTYNISSYECRYWIIWDLGYSFDLKYNIHKTL